MTRLGTHRHAARLRALAAACSALWATGLCGCAEQVRPQRPPNLIVVMTDDQGYHEWGAHDSQIHTPNLVRLAREGFSLDNFHVMSSCSPTRAAFLTGRHGQRTSVTSITVPVIASSSGHGSRGTQAGVPAGSG